MATYWEKLGEKAISTTDSSLEAFSNALKQAEEYAVITMDRVAPETDKYRGWLLYQYARAVRTLRCCRILIESGHALESFTLARTMVEAIILVKWVARDPQSRLERSMIGETLFSRNKTAKVLKGCVSTDEQRDILAKAAEASVTSKDHLPSIRDMAADMPGGIMLYASLYSMTSDLTHSHGPELQYIASATGSKLITPNIWPTQLFREVAVVTTYMVFRELVNSILSPLGLEEIGEFPGYQPLASLMRTMKSDLEDNGDGDNS